MLMFLIMRNGGGFHRSFLASAHLTRMSILLGKHTLTFLPVSIDINTGTAHLLDDTIAKLVGISVIQQSDITDKILGIILTDEAHHRAPVTANLLTIIQSGNLYGILRHDAIAVGVANKPIITLKGDRIFVNRAVLVDETDRQSVTQTLFVHIQVYSQVMETFIKVIGTF